MRHEYCPLCGDKLTHRDLGDDKDVPWCERCSRPFFDHSSVCVICLVINEDKNVLLIKQSYGADRFVTVAGYIKAGESAEEAVRREIAEETGLFVTSEEFLYSRYYEKHDNLMLAFACRVKNGEPRLSAEVREALWLDADSAHDRLHEESYLRTMIERYRDKI